MNKRCSCISFFTLWAEPTGAAVQVWQGEKLNEKSFWWRSWQHFAGWNLQWQGVVGNWGSIRNICIAAGTHSLWLRGLWIRNLPPGLLWIGWQGPELGPILKRPNIWKKGFNEFSEQCSLLTFTPSHRKSFCCPIKLTHIQKAENVFYKKYLIWTKGKKKRQKRQRQIE